MDQQASLRVSSTDPVLIAQVLYGTFQSYVDVTAAAKRFNGALIPFRTGLRRLLVRYYDRERTKLFGVDPMFVLGCCWG